MRTSWLVSPIRMVIVLVLVVFAGRSLLRVEAVVSRDHRGLFSTDPLANGSATPITTCDAGDLSCQTMAQTILSSTLRIEIKTWILYIEGQGWSRLASNGHGTVIDGRYLLTHNHFRLPLLELLADDFQGEFATITLYTADGAPLWQGPLTTAAVAFDDAETLLLEFRHPHGQGLFESLGIPSAAMAEEIVQVAPGATVAQVNWDMDQAYVQWTQVEDVLSEAGTPVLQLEDCIIGGSSGGGVFFNGQHIANNWTRSWGCDEEGSHESSRHSRAAVNSADLLAAVNARP